jgi:hypothetical protein
MVKPDMIGIKTDRLIVAVCALRPPMRISKKQYPIRLLGESDWHNECRCGKRHRGRCPEVEAITSTLYVTSRNIAAQAQSRGHSLSMTEHL